MTPGAADRSNSDGFLFITLTTFRKRKVFINDTVNPVLCGAMTFHIDNSHVDIAGYVIMPDHVHILVRPLEWDCTQFVNNFKSYTGINIKKLGGFSGKVWRGNFHLLPVAGSSAIRERLEMMHNNPVKANLAALPGDYPWSSYSNYHGLPGRVPVTVFE